MRDILFLALCVCTVACERSSSGPDLVGTDPGTLTAGTGTTTGTATGGTSTGGSATGGTATGYTGTPEDLDGDGSPNDEDCDDTDPWVHPGHEEICDGKDSDCDPTTGEEGLLSAAGTNHPNLQAAMDAASGSSGAVYACEGTHVGSGSTTSDLRIVGIGGAAAVTLQGDVAGEAVVELRLAELELVGLTITGGDGNLGGGIAASSATRVVIDSSIIDGNHAEFGGGAYLGGEVTVLDTVFSNNTSVSAGGGLRLNGSSVASLENVDILNNASNLGGGLYTEEATVVDGVDVLIDGNSANEGAGAYLLDTTALGLVVTNNHATNAGGGVYVRDNGTLEGVTITGNIADFDGGGVRAYLGLHSWTDVEVSGNIAVDDGGGVSASSVTLVSGADVVITGNFAETGSGGGLYYTDTDWTGGLVDGNEAQLGDGGGIAFSPSNVISTLTDQQITNNTAFRSGGGLYQSAGEATLNNLTLSYNYGVDRAGGAYIRGQGAIMTMTNSVVQGNSTDAYGGGIYVRDLAEAYITDSSIEDNLGVYGGGLYINDDAVVVLTGGAVIANGDQTNTGGGGARINLGVLTVDLTDFGEKGTDNSPDDVFIPGLGQSYTYGVDASFTCDLVVGCL